MRQIFFAGAACGLSVAIAAAALVGWHAPANAVVPMIVACPSVHPFRENTLLERGDLVAFTNENSRPRQFHRTLDFVPLRRFGGNHPLHYIADGWAYLLSDGDIWEQDLECTYADKSVVSFPLPHISIRGVGVCHFVMKLESEDSRFDIMMGWPHGVERKPMAVCSFDPTVVRDPNFKPQIRR